MMNNETNSMQALLEQKMVEWLAKKLNIPFEEVNLYTSFSEYNVDSITSAQLLNMLEEHVKTELDLYLTKDHNTIALLAAHLTMMQVSHSSTPTTKESRYDNYLAGPKVRLEAEIDN